MIIDNILIPKYIFIIKGKNMERDQILSLLAKHQSELRSRFGVSSMSLFGSVARGESTAVSDIDFLVGFIDTPGLFGFLELKCFLEDLYQRPVDLVTEGALKRPFRKQILQEAIHAL